MTSIEEIHNDTCPIFGEVTVKSFVSDDGSTYWIPNVSYGEKPIEGCQFSSLDQAYDFYRSYAKKSGFVAKLGGQYKPKKDEPVLLKYFLCSREGFKPKFNDAIDVDNQCNDSQNQDRGKKMKRNRPSCRIGCNAQLRLKLVPGNLYEVYRFVEAHNHPLVHDDDKKFLTSSRFLGYSKKLFLYQVSNENVGPVRCFKLMKELYGGFDKVGTTAVDCKNFKKDIQLFIGDRDAEMVVEKLIQNQHYLPNFYCDYMTDDDNALCGLFWADEYAKQNYDAFGDVVSFDATFRSNKYKMVFVPFTGIDNHNRCVTFGAGLISNETIESYKWLLERFQISFGVDPKVVVTDQDPALKQAIAIVFPDTRHRLCMWHIMQKLTTKVGTEICNNTDFKQRICDIVWTDKIEPEVFKREWVKLLVVFNLSENKWLQDMFDLRYHWIPAYFRHELLAGLMRTTSRSESENYFFGKFTSPYLTLVEFLSHYDTALDSQRYIHSKNQHDSRYTVPDLKTVFLLEKQASEIYTRTIFFDVQDQIYNSFSFCFSINVMEVGSAQKYVIHQIDSKNSIADAGAYIDFEVLFNHSEMIECSCRRFESYGLLCSHIFYVLRMAQVMEFPKKYVLKRWSIDAVPTKFVDRKRFSEKTNRPEVLREIHNAVDATFNQLVNDEEKLMTYLEDIKQLLTKAELEVSKSQKLSKNEVIASFLGVTVPAQVNIHVPKGIRNKGSGSHKRFKSKKELVIEESEKSKRKCKICKKRDGHDSRNCPKNKKKKKKLSAEVELTPVSSQGI